MPVTVAATNYASGGSLALYGVLVASIGFGLAWTAFVGKPFSHRAARAGNGVSGVILGVSGVVMCVVGVGQMLG